MEGSSAGFSSTVCARRRRDTLPSMTRTTLVIGALLITLSGCWIVPPNTEPFDADRDLSGELPVFPGAEGFGTDTPAGRGGAVVIVTSLADSGPGTLREALEEGEGPRTVVFEVGGVIDLEREIAIRAPFVTVAGQTAPAPGITLIGAGIDVMTHDVLIQHIAARPGDREEGPKPENRDGISVVGDRRGEIEVYNVVIDHCSFSWAIDEVASTWYTNVHDITFSNCIIAEGLSESLHPENEHSKGLLIGDHSRRVAILGNLFAHNMRRSPLLKGDTSSIVAGNLIYNPGTAAIDFSDRERSGPARATIVANVLIRGADTSEWMSMISLATRVYDTMQIYYDANVELVGEGPTEAQADAESIRATDPPSSMPAFEPEARLLEVTVNDPPVTLAPLTVPTPAEVYEAVLTNAGSTPWQRSSVDQRIVDSVRERTGTIIDSQSEVGGFPDDEQASHTLAIPEDPNSDDDEDGYTNLEEWIHSLQ